MRHEYDDNDERYFFSTITIYILTDLEKTLRKIKYELYKKQDNTKTAPLCFFTNNTSKKITFMSTKANKQITKDKKRKIVKGIVFVSSKLSFIYLIVAVSSYKD